MPEGFGDDMIVTGLHDDGQSLNTLIGQVHEIGRKSFSQIPDVALSLTGEYIIGCNEADPERFRNIAAPLIGNAGVSNTDYVSRKSQDGWAPAWPLGGAVVPGSPACPQILYSETSTEWVAILGS
ncbi:hypothetical protein JX265_002425 [Neoarthrinium moseri]|uniref:Uncharacterized protein n=1 Tax=Neoarthrinium moseri TaxID=1658444 RepID=A0A9P9WV17_9PEZI|nr:hypothetical protein JX265_002425 [Neoarthrinium moseri]